MGGSSTDHGSTPGARPSGEGADSRERSLDTVQWATATLARRGEYVHFAAGRVAGPPIDRLGFLLLEHLAAHGTQSMAELAHAFDVNPSTISRQVAALEEHDRVARSRHEQNHRIVHVTLTPTGERDLAAVRAARILLWKDLLADWDDDDLDVLAGSLERYAASLAADTSSPRDR